MAASRISEALTHLRRTALLPDGAGLTDGQLLEGFISRRDEAALAVLVKRHGPMVWGVCRRVLRNYHDAEDAFQATFLVLVRKAASIASRELVANWLYGVAHRTALKARATAASRRGRERQVTDLPEPATTEPGLGDDLQPLLDWELSHLPDKYRIAIVLCDLEGKTRKEAARQLGVPEGTLAARVARARGMLAKRLARQGLVPAVGALGLALAQKAAAVPAVVVSSTIKAASALAAGQASAAGAVSPRVAALTDGALKTMLPSKLRVAVVLLLALAALATCPGPLATCTGAGEPRPPVSRTAVPRKDKGNLEETVLALEKRLWEAHVRQDVNVFKSLLADDFVGKDIRGDRYDREGALHYVATHRVVGPVMTNARALVLNATSAIVTYEIRYKVVSPGGQKAVPVPPRRAITAWAMRDGKWWYVYCEARPVRAPAPQ
jgi:RNA polymerase sigma factor (sigma-70 family)